MAKSRIRLEKTLADYIVIAISPVLIMFLVGSLVFFLLQASYRGEFESRLHWIMFWYVFAAVLVARIAIEEGKEHARMFGIVMGAVAALAVWRFVDSALLGWLMLGIVWWCSSKLTWDCTMIDDSEDASGEGLLEVAGLSGAPPEEPPKQEAAITPVEPKAKKKKQKGKSSKSKKGKKSKKSDAEQAESPKESRDSDDGDLFNPKTKSHSPGLWVVYFSLAALPLFGIGQLFIPMAEEARRTYAFQLLAVYVASAMALLLTTSFLGLRRYLRQRKLEMPASITRGWLGVGIVLVIGLMVVAVLVPRPQAEYSITKLIDKVDQKARQASNWAILKGDRAQGEGRRIGDQDAKSDKKGEGGGKSPPPDQAQSPDNKAPGGEKSGNASKGKAGDQSGKDGKQPGDKSGGDQQRKDASGQQNQNGDKSSQKSESNDKSGNQKNTSGDQAKENRNSDSKGDQNQARQANNQNQQQQNKRDANAQKNPTQPDSSKSSAATPSKSMLSKLTSSTGGIVKWILYGLLLLVGLYFLIRHWAWIADFCAKLWAEFLSLFGWRTGPTAEGKVQALELPAKVVRPFASYRNPFLTGTADRMSSRELVRYTFEALEAWSRENSVERAPQQTVLEFAEAIGKEEPQLANSVNQAALLYARAAYAPKSAVKERMEVLERLWQQLKV